MSVYSHLNARNLRERKVWAILAFALVILTIPIFAAVMGALATTNANNGDLTGTNSITSMVSEIWGYGNSTSGWKQATLTLAAPSHSVTATFPAGFKVSYAIIATGNSSYNVLHILEHSYLYSYSAITSTAGTKLDDAYSYIATFHNSSATTSRNDKSIVAPSVNTTIFSSQTNNLGQELAYPIMNLFASNYNAVPMYALNLTTTNTTSTYQASFTFENYLQQPYTYNLFFDAAAIMSIVALVDIALLWNVLPRHQGGMF